jgi:hypothetical protein
MYYICICLIHLSYSFLFILIHSYSFLFILIHCKSRCVFFCCSGLSENEGYRIDIDEWKVIF